MSDTTETPEVYNAGDPVAVQGKASKQKRAQAEADMALATLLRTTPGRRWMWATLCGCGVYATTFRPDGLTMAFNEGQRAVGLRLLADVMRVAPDQYVTMAEENAQAP